MLILRISGISLLGLGALAGVVLLLLPFGNLQRYGLFLGQPVTPLWLLAILALTFGGLFLALAMRKPRSWTSTKVGGAALLAFGFVCALEIFLIEALMPRRIVSLWWLFVLTSVSGAVTVYAADWAERQAEKEKAEEAERQAKKPVRAENAQVTPVAVCHKKPRLVRVR